MASNLPSAPFVAAVAREVKQHFSRLGKEPRSAVRYRLAQFWWDEPASIHYELAVHERSMQVEIGLHFEAGAEKNRELYHYFNRRLLEIQNELGDSIWIEDWDKGWTRIYETQPLSPLDEARVYSVAGRLCEIIECLQPLLEQTANDI